ncbi:MAG: 4Fe-4S binding protein [Chloroflexota bacterium]|nr:4Fe-4S binding protein [Chloroflexota bacterium]
MIANYGYKDGSGEYFISIDTDRCDGCGDCVTACRTGVLEMIVDDYDENVAAVTDDQRKKLKYSCAPCKPMSNRPVLPCISACAPAALQHSW